jgi:hypothetical protein
MNLSREIDAKAHAAARNSSYVYPWLRTTSFTNPEEQERWFQNSQHFFSVQDHGNFIGMVGFTDVNANDAEFSCLIYPQHQGKGYGSKALHMLFDYGFNQLGLKLIYGNTYAYPIDRFPIYPHPYQPTHIQDLGLVYLNPAIKLFEKFNMTISGPCLYPVPTNEKKGVYVWKLLLPRHKYDSNLA